MAKRFKLKKRIKSKRKKSYKFFSWKSVVGLSFFAVLLSVGYLSQVSAVSSKSYKFRALESEISELKEQQDKLELQAAVEKSMNVVEARVNEMGMVPTENVDYLTATIPVVAKR